MLPPSEPPVTTLKAADGIRFATTSWTLVFQAARGGDPEAQDAWDKLDARYRRPLYAYARSKGDPHPVAEERVQGFMASVFRPERLGRLDPGGGRLRNWLLVSFNHYRQLRHREDTALKRAPHGGWVSLDDPEGHVGHAQLIDIDARKAFDLEWAHATLDAAREALRQQYESRGLSQRFDVFWPRLHPRANPGDIADPAEALGLTPKSFATALHRFRRDYQAVLRSVLRQSLDEGEDVEAEIQDLMRAVS